MLAIFAILNYINGKIKEGKGNEIEPVAIVIGFILCFVFMPIALLLFIIDEVIILTKHCNENKGF
jgi:hypothetical protein